MAIIAGAPRTEEGLGHRPLMTRTPLLLAGPSSVRYVACPRDYGAGSTTVLPLMLTAVCPSSLPLIDAPVWSETDV